jgi:hypothetical protein
MHSCLINTAALEGFLRGLEGNGCDVTRDRQAGTVVARDGETVVLRAIQKGRGQPWIATFIDSGRITWKRPPGVPDGRR